MVILGWRKPVVLNRCPPLNSCPGILSKYSIPAAGKEGASPFAQTSDPPLGGPFDFVPDASSLPNRLISPLLISMW